MTVEHGRAAERSSTSTRTSPRATRSSSALDETLFVEAGAGSGKTKALVDRIVALVVDARRADARDRRDHLHREGAAELRDRIRRALEPVGPRRRSGRRGRGAARRARRARRRRGLHAARLRPAHPHRAPDRGRAAAAHRGARRDRVAARVRGALDAASSTSCSTIPRSSARCSSRSTPTPPSPCCARSRSRSTPTGTSSPSAWAPSPTRRRSTSTSRRCSPRSTQRARARRALPRRRRQAARDGSSTLAAWHDALARRARRVRAAAAAHRGRADGQRHGTAGRATGPTCDRRRRARRGRRRSGALVDRAARDRSPRPSSRRLAWELAQFTLREAASAAGRRRARVPRPARARPRAAARPGARLGGAPAPARPLHRACCSTSSRTPTRSRSSSPRCSRRASPTPRAHRWDELAGRPRPPVRRRRPQAVDLPLPPRRHRRVPAGRARRSAASPRHLTRNFRTARPVIDWVNTIFGELIVGRARVAARVRRARARARARRRSGPRSRCSAPTPDARGAPAPTTCASARPPTSPRSSRRALARAGRSCAARRRRRHERGEPCRLGDICILLPARTSLGHLEDALDAAGIPYRAETSSLVYSTREVRDLLDGAAGGRRPHRRARARDRAALAAVRLRRRRPLHVQGRARRPLGPPARRCPSRCRPTTRSATRSRASPAWHDARLLARRRASCSTASCASGACSRSGSRTAGRATCGGGCAS